MTAVPEPEGNTRGLLKSMLVIASAQFATIAIRILRAKIMAMMLGPAGIGLLSIVYNFQQLGTQAAGLGLPMSGVRELAATRADDTEVAQVRRVLIVALALQGGLAMVAVWAMREPLAIWLMGEAGHVTQIGLVGVAMFLFLLASSQDTLLQGMRRIGDLGRVMVLGTLAGSIVGVLAIWILGMDGLIWMILAEALAVLIVAWFYARRLPLPDPGWLTPGELLKRWWPMVRLGMVFMLGGLLTTATLLLVRTLITRELGLVAAGQFAAAWTITMIYVGFMLDAMAKDYYPRLTEVIDDQAASSRLMNDQMHLALALGGPILLLMIGLAPWATWLLYSNEFGAAATLIQWQMAGNVFKLASWVLAFSFIAARRGALFLGLEFLFNFLFLVVVFLGSSVVGLDIAGIAFLISYMAYFGLVMIFANWKSGFRWQSGPLKLFVLHVVLALTLLVVARMDHSAGAAAGIIISMVTAFIGLHAVISRSGQHGRVVSRISRAYAIIGWPVRSNR